MRKGGFCSKKKVGLESSRDANQRSDIVGGGGGGGGGGGELGGGVGGGGWG